MGSPTLFSLYCLCDECFKVSLTLNICSRIKVLKTSNVPLCIARDRYLPYKLPVLLHTFLYDKRCASRVYLTDPFEDLIGDKDISVTDTSIYIMSGT
jgi:hypothetical protein